MFEVFCFFSFVDLTISRKWYANGLWIAVLCYAPPSIATVLLVRNASLSKSFLQLTPLTNHPQELIPLSPANDDDQPEDFKISSPSYLHSQSHQQSSRSLAALLLLWSLLLILGTWSGVMSSYCLGTLFSILEFFIYSGLYSVIQRFASGFLVVFPLLGHILFQALIHRGTSLSHSILAYLICLTPAALHWIELFYGLMDMLLPLLGTVISSAHLQLK